MRDAKHELLVIIKPEIAYLKPKPNFSKTFSEDNNLSRMLHFAPIIANS